MFIQDWQMRYGDDARKTAGVITATQKDEHYDDGVYSIFFKKGICTWF